MQSWRLLQLEPTALRSPDQFSDESRLSATGQHLPNALNRLGNFGDVANQLSELIPGVQSLQVHQDETRQQRTLSVTMSDRQRYSASSLSDGTLRFLALAVLSNDPEATGIVCMEEPENGIHPLRIPEMLRLVRGLSDADLIMRNLDEREGLRQVIINTHSPLVVAELPDDELLMAETVRFKGASFVNFKPLGGTWRTISPGSPDAGTISRGELHAYLSGQSQAFARTKRKLVRDHLPPPTTADLFQTVGLDD
jgi:predicted ATPase